MFWLGSRHLTADWSRTLNDGGQVPEKKSQIIILSFFLILFPYFDVISRQLFFLILFPYLNVVSRQSFFLILFPYFDVISRQSFF